VRATLWREHPIFYSFISKDLQSPAKVAELAQMLLRLLRDDAAALSNARAEQDAPAEASTRGRDEPSTSRGARTLRQCLRSRAYQSLTVRAALTIVAHSRSARAFPSLPHLRRRCWLLTTWP